MATGILDVTVVSASLTRIEDRETYVSVKCGYEQFQTHAVSDHSSSPTWNKTSTLSLQGENKNNNIIVELYGIRQQSQELLGLVRIPLSKILSTAGTSVYTLTRPDLGEAGQIKIAFHWESSAAQVLDNQGFYSASTGKEQSNTGSMYSAAPSAPSFPESANYDFSSYKTPESLRPISKSNVDSATAAFAGLDIASNPTYTDPSAKYYGVRSTDEGKTYPPPGSAGGPVADYRHPPPPYPPFTSVAAEAVPTQSPYPPPPYPLPSDSPSDLAARHPPPPSSYPPPAATNTQPGAPYSASGPTYPGYPPKEFQTTPAASPYESTYPPAVPQTNHPHAGSKGSNYEYAYPPSSNENTTPINNLPVPYGQAGSSHNVDDTKERGTKLTQDRGKNSSYGYQPGGNPPPAPYPQGYPPAGYPPPQAAGYPPPQAAGYPPSGYSGYPPSGYPPAPYPQSGYAPQYPSYPPAPYPSAHGYYAAPSHSSHGPNLGYMGAAAGYGAHALHGHGQHQGYGYGQHQGYGHGQHHGHGHKQHHGHGHVKHHKEHHYGHPVHFAHGHHHKHKHHKHKSFFGKWK
ncbi:hypothetical protein O6H91_23G035200 [Diphasiastrum complanatum]|uniref:Uncharacterized protein n=1 Tax=Diphasiastrum complanatum TaxID=34168 RepID=A0ACC2A9P5_DIPCM|nr:hypothetical protein O6H91_23G035200 [Diphasiastrum complanatum]